MSSFNQIRLYRKRAAEMELLAAETKFTSMRESFLRLAEEWNLLADSLEHQAQRSGGGPVPPDAGGPRQR